MLRYPIAAMHHIFMATMFSCDLMEEEQVKMQNHRKQKKQLGNDRVHRKPNRYLHTFLRHGRLQRDGCYLKGTFGFKNREDREDLLYKSKRKDMKHKIEDLPQLSLLDHYTQWALSPSDVFTGGCGSASQLPICFKLQKSWSKIGHAARVLGSQ